MRPLTPSETDDFSALHKVFESYLFQLVHGKEDAFCITLKTALPDVPTKKIITTYQPGHQQVTYNLEIRILTPAFYSRLIHYSYTSEAFDRECLFTDERNRTLWVCRPQLLALLLEEKSSIQTAGLPAVNRSHLNELRWTFLRKLRCPPSAPAYSLTPKSSVFNIDDIRPRPYSELDNFVRSFRGYSYAAEYRRAVTKLFLAQRFCFGFSEVVTLVDLSLRVLLSYIAVLQIKYWDLRIGNKEVLFDLEGMVLGSRWWSLLGIASSMSACHAYGLLKGYK